MSARNIIVERPEDVDAIGTVGHATSAITKMDLASLITFTMKRPATAASKEEEPVSKKPSSYAPPPVAPSPPPMQLPVTAAVAAVTKAPTVSRPNDFREVIIVLCLIKTNGTQKVSERKSWNVIMWSFPQVNQYQNGAQAFPKKDFLSSA